MKSRIVGYFGSFADAYERVGKRFKQSGNFSIQRSSEAKDHPWTLIYFGNFR